MQGYWPINEKKVKVHRIIKDMEFAAIILDAGDKELSDKTLKNIETKIK